MDPALIIIHLGRRVELERLVLHIELKPGDRLLNVLKKKVGGRRVLCSVWK